MKPSWVEYIRLTFTDFIAALGVQPERRPGLVKDLLKAAREHDDENWYEATGHRICETQSQTKSGLELWTNALRVFSLRSSRTSNLGRHWTTDADLEMSVG